MAWTWLTTGSMRRWVALAVAGVTLLGIVVTVAWWDPLDRADASTAGANHGLTVAWTGDLSQFPGPGWRQSWGVSDAGSYRLEQLQAVTDDSAPGGRALAVDYPAGSSTPACTNCPQPGGAQFLTQPTLTAGGALSAATTVDLSYAVRFPHEFDFGRGGFLPGLYGGQIGEDTGGKHSQGWSTRLIWAPADGVIGAGIQVYTPANTAAGDQRGVGRWQFTADDQWHQVEQAVDLATNSITVWYDGREMVKTKVSGLTGIPAAGVMFSSFFGGDDSSWGPRSEAVAEFADFTMRTNNAGKPNRTPGPGTGTPAPGGTGGTGGNDLSDPAKKEIALELVSSAENSTLDWKSQFAYIEDIGDGRGYTAGISGFCSGTGDMLDLVNAYTKAAPNNILAKYLPALRKVNNTDSHAGLDPDFPKDWRTAAKDPAFQRVQESERDRVYFNPAVVQGKQDGLGMLGQFIYFDAITMHGPGDDKDSFGGIRKTAMAKAKTPAQGGDQTAYLNAFLDARAAAMRTEEAHSDTSRVDTEQRVFLKAGNLDLNPPLSWKVYGDPYHIDAAPGVSTSSVAATKPRMSSSPTPTAAAGGKGRTSKYYVTLYGAHDNTPANSRDIAYPVIHKEAAGTGTYADPITFATDKAELAVGTIVYYPYLKRYFIMEDDCTECDQDWTGKGPDGGPRYAHIDLWAGASNDPAIETCEDALTQDGQVDVIVDPPSTGLPVDTAPLYNNGKCYSPAKGG